MLPVHYLKWPLTTVACDNCVLCVCVVFVLCVFSVCALTMLEIWRNFRYLIWAPRHIAIIGRRKFVFALELQLIHWQIHKMTNWHTHTNTHWQIDKASDNVHAQAANQLGIIKCILKQFVGIKFGTTQRVSETGATRGNCCCVSSAEGAKGEGKGNGLAAWASFECCYCLCCHCCWRLENVAINVTLS